MHHYFRTDVRSVVDSPNGQPWWHWMPLPDGDRIKGANPDHDVQLKMWRALQIEDEGGLAGKLVLDIGANDGYFSLAALMAGARHVVAMNTSDWVGWPANLQYASERWGVFPEVVTADFRTAQFEELFDVIFFFGVLYHVEDVFSCMKTLDRLLADDGVVYLETQMTTIASDRPIFESASDLYQTTAPQGKSGLTQVGLSNYLFPNEHAIRNLAYSYDFECDSLNGSHNEYTRSHPSREFFRLTKRRSVSARVA